METLKRFGPKAKDHPSIGQICKACEKEFKEGDFTTLIALGPGDDQEARERCAQVRPYTAVAIEIHWACAGGLADTTIVATKEKTEKKIERILIDGGETFDGTLQQFKDSFFDNAGVATIQAWCGSWATYEIIFSNGEKISG